MHGPEWADESNYVGLNWFIDTFIGINTDGLNFNEIMLIVAFSKTPKLTPALPQNCPLLRQPMSVLQFVDALKIDTVSPLFARVMP